MNITVNKIKYEYEIEGVFDSEYALKITRPFSETSSETIHREIYSHRPDEKYIRYIIEQIQKTR